MKFSKGAVRVDIMPPDPDRSWLANLFFGRSRRRLARALTFTCYLNGKELEIVVPEGFITDFGTIPRLLWAILPPSHHHYIRSTIIHDYALKEINISRADCHTILEKAMRVEKCPRWKRKLMVWACRRLNS